MRSREKGDRGTESVWVGGGGGGGVLRYNPEGQVLWLCANVFRISLQYPVHADEGGERGTLINESMLVAGFGKAAKSLMQME